MIKHKPGQDQFISKYSKFKGLIPPSPSPQFSEIMDLEFHSRSKNGYQLFVGQFLDILDFDPLGVKKWFKMLQHFFKFFT